MKILNTYCENYNYFIKKKQYNRELDNNINIIKNKYCCIFNNSQPITIDLKNFNNDEINIKNLRKGKRTSRYLSAWAYPLIRDGLVEKSLRLGVQVDKICPTYTSQRCSKCGWTRKKSRKGKKFICTACGFACDADHNASLNISLDLTEISKGERLLHKNIKGFYWYVVGQEPIVPAVQKAS